MPGGSLNGTSLSVDKDRELQERYFQMIRGSFNAFGATVTNLQEEKKPVKTIEEQLREGKLDVVDPENPMLTISYSKREAKRILKKADKESQRSTFSLGGFNIVVKKRFNKLQKFMWKFFFNIDVKE